MKTTTFADLTDLAAVANQSHIAGQEAVRDPEQTLVTEIAVEPA